MGRGSKIHWIGFFNPLAKAQRSSRKRSTTRESDRQRIHEYVNRDFVVVDLSIADMERLTCVCIAVDRLAQSVDRTTNRKLGQLNVSTSLIEVIDNYDILNESG